MSLGDSFEELETLDLPRGVVAAANRYAGDKAPLIDAVKAARGLPTADAISILEANKPLYESCFDAFIAGAKWAIADTSDCRCGRCKVCEVGRISPGKTP